MSYILSRKRIVFVIAFVTGTFIHAQQIVTDPTLYMNNAIQHGQNLSNFASQLANLEENLKIVTESKELFSSAYAISNLLGGSQKLNELIQTASEYRTLYNVVAEDIEYYKDQGLLSASQVANSTAIMVRGMGMILGDVAYVTGHVIKDNGLSAADRLTVLDKIQGRCREEIDKLLTIHREVASEPVKRQLSTDMSYCVNAALSPVPLLGPVREHTEESNDAAVNDPFIRGIVSKAADVRTDTSLTEVQSGGRAIYRDAVNIVSALIGIVAALMFVFAFERRNRGEHQSQDSIYKVCLGMVFAIIALQIITRLFLF